MKSEEILNKYSPVPVKGTVLWAAVLAAMEEYASKGMRWGSEDKPDLAHEALERNYPEREGAFGSTWTDGYMQCMRDIENGDLKSQSTQEGGTVERGISFSDATDKKRIEELEKEVERVGIMLVKAMGEVNDRDLEVERLEYNLKILKEHRGIA